MLRRIAHLIPVVALFLALAAGVALAGEFEREFTFASADLKLVNMIGSVAVTAAEGEDFLLKVVVRGADATADLLEFANPGGDGDVLAIRFPLKEHQHYVYPPLGRGSKTTMHFRNEGEEGKSWLKKIFSGLSGTSVTVRGKGSGLEVWADVTIAVPRDARLEVRHGVGEIQAADLAAELYLDINSGGITVRRLTGDLLADTGSGRVVAAAVQGDLNLDTGSGEVDISACEGETVKIDTGSGRVTADGVLCRYLDVDTGSGSVKAVAVATDGARIDTGSGSVVLQLDRMGSGDFLVDTGSGAIELILPAGASAHITADTGSGSVKSDLAEARVISQDKGVLEIVAGGGAARVNLDAGSGSIEIRDR